MEIADQIISAQELKRIRIIRREQMSDCLLSFFMLGRRPGNHYEKNEHTFDKNNDSRHVQML